MVVNKPSGLVVHSDGRTKEKTLADWVLENYPETENVGEPIIKTNGEKILRPGIVHRLDRDTSGVMLIAKNKESFENLKEQFKNHTIIKKYETFVFGVVKDKEGIINRPITRSKSDFRKWSAQRGGRGEPREALTKYKVILENNDYSFLEVMPETGRTHQIRVHMKFLNHPVVCDSLYNPDNPCPKNISRMALHAKSIEFKNLNGKIIKIESKLPKFFPK